MPKSTMQHFNLQGHIGIGARLGICRSLPDVCSNAFARANFRKKASAFDDAVAIALRSAKLFANYEQYAPAAEAACLCVDSWREKAQPIDETKLGAHTSNFCIPQTNFLIMRVIICF